MTIDTIISARTAILAAGAQLLANEEPFLGKIRAALDALSPVDQICMIIETVWANPEAANEPTRRLAAALCDFASANNFYGLAVDLRGLKIQLALLRDLGDEAPPQGWPEPESDPARIDAYIVSEPAAPIPTGAE